MAYKIEPYEATKPSGVNNNNNNNSEENSKQEHSFLNQLKQYDERFANLEQKVLEIQNSMSKNKGEWSV